MDGDGYVGRVSELIDMLQTKRLVRATVPIEISPGNVGHIELLFAPPPPPKAKKGDRDPLKERREHYELSLGRPVSDKELELLP